MKRNQQGFGTVEIVLAVLVVVIIGFGAWRITQNKQETTAKAPSTSTSSKNEAAQANDAPTSKLGQTFTDNIGNFSLKYPADWKLKEGESSVADKYSNATLTSPTGTVLVLKSNQGGKGGTCEPATSDVAFKAGNTCPSIEFLSKETLPIKNVYYVDRYEAGKNVMKADTITLITHQYADLTGVRDYTVGIGSETTDYNVSVNEKLMGAVTNDPFVTVYNAAGDFLPYVYISATSKDEGFLKSADVNTIKDIIRTLRFNI